MAVFLFCTKSKKGFLLIELLVALAILSGLVLVASSQVWQTIRLQKDAELRLKALNASISLLEHNNFIEQQQTIESGIKIFLHSKSVDIDQEKIDRLIPGKPLKKFKPMAVTVEWQSFSGKQESLCLVTGFAGGEEKT